MTSTPTPSIIDTRRDQMFPTLEALEVERVRRFGKIRAFAPTEKLAQVGKVSGGLSIIVSHHDRKAAVDDFVDSVSGTHGLAGAADSIMVLARRRQAADAVLKVTGRDVPEDEYALTISDGRSWQASGASLAAAADRARQRKDAQALSPTMTVSRARAIYTPMSDDPTYLAGQETIYAGMRKAGVPEQ